MTGVKIVGIGRPDADSCSTDEPAGRVMGAPANCPGKEVGLPKAPISIGVPMVERIGLPPNSVVPDVVEEVSTITSPLDAVLLTMIGEGLEVATMISPLDTVLLTRTCGGVEVAMMTSPLEARWLTTTGTAPEAIEVIELTKAEDKGEASTVTSPFGAVEVIRMTGIELPTVAPFEAVDSMRPEAGVEVSTIT